MKKQINLILLILFPVYSFMSWLYVYNFHKLGQASRVKLLENNYFLGLDSKLISLTSILLLLISIYLIIKNLKTDNVVFKNILFLILILFLLFYNIWSIL
jgi:hypothetical protein